MYDKKAKKFIKDKMIFPLLYQIKVIVIYQEKMHKENHPLRPVVSNVGSRTFNMASKVLSSFKLALTEQTKISFPL